MDEPRVSIVVVNWNRYDDVARVVRHLAKLQWERAEFRGHCCRQRLNR